MNELRNKIVYETAEAVSNIENLSSALNKYNSSAANVARSAKTVGKSTSTSASKINKSSYDMYMGVRKSSKGAEEAVTSLGIDNKKATGDMFLSRQSVIRLFTILGVNQGFSTVTSAILEGSDTTR